MQIVDAYHVIVTKAVSECRDFYVRWFGFEVAFEASWFVLLSSPGEQPLSIAFMQPEHPSSPPAPGSHAGDGSFLTLQVEDAAQEFQRVTSAGLVPALALTVEPWGQRRFGLVDPAGMWVDIVEQIEPVEGWWDPYVSES